MVRDMIVIDEETCTGCGACVPGCPEGALQIIDGKARLVGEILCDGLGACIGKCPVGALSVERREAEEYDEDRVMRNIVPQGVNTILAHLDHLERNGAAEYLASALHWIRSHEFAGKAEVIAQRSASRPPAAPVTCPGTAARTLSRRPHETQMGGHGDVDTAPSPTPSALGQWPIQLRLLNPNAAFLQKSDLILAADCTAFALGGFHSEILSGKSLAIACPKLDHDVALYVERLAEIIDTALINTISVIMMEVPCCGGLLQIARQALSIAQRAVPIKQIIVSVEGEIIREEWT